MRPWGALAGILAFLVFPFAVWGQTAPGKPDAPSVTPTDGTLSLSWTAPTDVGSGITHYDVHFRVRPYGQWATSGDITGTTHTLGSNLYQNKEYELRVRASHRWHGGDEDGPWSDITTAIPKTPTKPSKPSKLTGTVGDKSVTLRWEMDVGDDGNSAITGWEYVKKVDSGDFETTWNSLSGVTVDDSKWPKVYTVTLTGLTNFTPYKFKVRGKNTYGDGAASEESASLTPVVLTLPSVADLSWIKNSAVSVTLPEANHGTAPRTYSLAGSLPTGVNFTASTRVLAGTPSATQDETTYTYTVRDADGVEDTEEFTITVEEDTSPTLTATSDQDWFKDAAVSLTLPAASNGNEPLTYTLTGTLPTGVSFSASTRVLSGTPTATQSAATYTYKVRDRNGDEATDEFTIAVEEDTSPTLAATSDQSWFKDAAVSLTLPAASNGNEPLTYTLTGTLPTGVSFSASTRVLSGTPTATQSAETYTYKVRDRDGDEATDVFTVAVAIDTQPSLTAVGDRNWVKGDVTKKWLPEATSGNTPLTYTLSGTLPTGMTFDASKRLISGTPSAAQTAKSYTYKVRDADGDEATSKFSITVVTDPLSVGERPELAYGHRGIADAA